MYVGGIRSRLIKDNVYNFLKSGLTELDWFATGRQHQAVILHPKASPWDEELKPNAITLSVETVSEFPAEMGSLLAEHTWQYYVDVFAEDDSVGVHLATDIRDMLLGHITSISSSGPSIPVYDLTVQSATPIDLFSVQVDSVSMDKGREYTMPTKKFWWQIAFEVIDAYGTESY